MNYSESIEWFHSLLRFGIRPGLERITALCGALGNPQEGMKYVHIAGTNGKGSTAAMTDGILRAAGYKTGLFTSPYVFDFRERIKLDGEMIPEAALAECADAVRRAAEGLSAELAPTEFEAVTAAAFKYFFREGCEIAVLETGLGGRLDSTNVVAAPEVCALTSISLDHTELLGGTVEEIAAEKCGIFKPGADVVVYPEQDAAALRVIETACEALGLTPAEVPAYRVRDGESVKPPARRVPGTEAEIGGIELFVPFIGEHMLKNACVAVAVARCLRRRGMKITDGDTAEGIASASMPARMQIISDEPLIMLDGGHNEGCAAALREVVGRYFGGREVYAVCGMMADKDCGRYLEILAPELAALYAASPGNPRAVPAGTLAREASRHTRAVPCQSPREAFERAVKSAGRGGAVLVCGSFYLMSELGLELSAQHLSRF